MPMYTKKFKEEWQFFIDQKTNNLTYNKLCKACKNDCKQSFRVSIVYCKHYEKELTEERKC